MNPLNDDDDQTHREFLRGLSIQLGQILATYRGGHPAPSPEVAEKEIEDVLRHYITMEKADISSLIERTAFTMVRLLDPYNRKTFTYTAYLVEVFISFFMSNLKILIDRGVVSVVDPPDIEKTWKLSTEQKFMDQELADLDIWNNVLKTTLEDILNDENGISDNELYDDSEEEEFDE